MLAHEMKMSLKCQLPGLNWYEAYQLVDDHSKLVSENGIRLQHKDHGFLEVDLTQIYSVNMAITTEKNESVIKFLLFNSLGVIVAELCVYSISQFNQWRNSLHFN